MPRTYAQIAGFVGVGLFMTFILGLIYSISTGFAGFWGGLPVWIISLFVIALALYDYWDACFRKHPE